MKDDGLREFVTWKWNRFYWQKWREGKTWSRKKNGFTKMYTYYLMWQIHFLDRIKLRTLRWGRYSRLSGRASCNYKGPQKWKMEVKESQRKEWPWKRLEWRDVTAAYEGGERNTSQSLQAAPRCWKRQGSGFSSGVSRKECNPSDNASSPVRSSVRLLPNKTVR